MPFSRLKELNTKDCLWIYILRILAEKESHAYTIRKEIQKRYSFTPGTMTAYKVLYLLHRKGFVSQKKEGRKKIYSLTVKGRSELMKARKFYQGLARELSKN